MKTIELTAQSRETVGKRNTKDLRKAGSVPGVVYANGSAQHISVVEKDMKPIIYTADSFVVNLNIDGTVVSSIVRDTDFHPVTEKMTHVEFLAVTDDKPVIVNLPLKLVGVPKGVTKGGKIVVKLRKLSVKGIPSKLPDFVEVPVADLDLGSTIKVSDVDFGDLHVMTSASAGIASVEIPRALRSAASAAGADASEPADEA